MTRGLSPLPRWFDSQNQAGATVPGASLVVIR